MKANISWTRTPASGITKQEVLYTVNGGARQTAEVGPTATSHAFECSKGDVIRWHVRTTANGAVTETPDQEVTA